VKFSLLSPGNGITRKQDRQIKAALFQFLEDTHRKLKLQPISLLLYLQLSSIYIDCFHCEVLLWITWKSLIRRFHQCVYIWSFTWQLHDAYRLYKSTRRRL